ncbi:MAG: DNA polymerase III subunit alpha [Acidimicrobiales bacterium]
MSGARSFVHLHTHTEFSMLDGASRIDELIDACVADGQPAIAITDHGNLYGVLDFYETCRNKGIKPIIGLEAYMAAESRFERPVARGKSDDDMGGESDKGSKVYYHLIVLAETTTGYRNLMKIASYGSVDGGYYYKPRIDWEILDRFHEGLNVTTACLGGLVPQALLAGDDQKAEKLAGRLQDIFGRDHLFVEIQDHGIADQRRILPSLVKLARRLDAPLVATNDSHYIHREDALAHDALLCIQTRKQKDDPSRLRFEGTEHYVKTADEMRTIFQEFPEACDSTIEIAERSNVEIDFGYDALPEYPLPEHISVSMQDASYKERGDAYLSQLAHEGAERRYGSPIEEHVKQRISYELSVISQMGFSSYFLIVADLVDHAKKAGIRVGPGRGSAAGCCVAYCLGIVELDPIRYDLLFERFLNPGRKQMPDIDMDFDERYRGEMINYAAMRYGEDHVAQIITFSTIKARAAVRDAARVLGYPYALGDKIAKAMPPLVMGRDTPLKACFENVPGHEDGYRVAGELREMYGEDPEAKQVVDVARGLEGLRRQDSIHAAAVVITKEPLMEYLPVQRKPEQGKDLMEAPLVTQYEMHGVEKLGLLKMDFLGLRNLSVITRSLEIVEQTTGEKIDIDKVPLDDVGVYSMLCKGSSIGVFQLEGSQMRSLMRSLQPTCFDDIAALVALYRPGPMAANMHRDYADRKNGRSPITYLHDDLEPILKDTYGLMIYQESVMRVAQRFAGYSLEEADNLRKACGKKDRDMIARERNKFVSGCRESGYTEKLGTQLFDIIEPFADYAFNKSHSYGYGLIAYQNAWLKFHYPVEYMCALLSSVRDDKDKTAVYLSECRSLNIEVLVPDVNRSQVDFTPTHQDGGDCVLFGLAAVRNVGTSIVEKIIEERERNGSFEDFYDFCLRVPPAVLGQKPLQSLILAGAFDSLGYKRKGLLDNSEAISRQILERRKEEDVGVMTLFSMLEENGEGGEPRHGVRSIEVPEVEMSASEKLAREKEMLGLYVSGHPLDGFERSARAVADMSVADLRLPASSDQELMQAREGTVCTLCGVVTATKSKRTKKGDLMMTFVLDDTSASIEVTAFSKALETSQVDVTDDKILLVKGRLDTRDDELKLIAISLADPQLRAADSDLHINIPGELLDRSGVEKLKKLLDDYPGEERVVVTAGERTYRLPPSVKVDSRSGLLAELRECFGNSIEVS